MSTRTITYVVQEERFVGQIGKQRTAWIDLSTRTNLTEATISLERMIKAERECGPSKFTTGNFRIVQRETVVTETVRSTACSREG